MTKREFLAGAVGSGLLMAGASSALAQAGGVRVRKAKTTKLFKSPSGFPNALALSPEGLWIGEQKLSAALAAQYHMPEPKSLDEEAWLVDWNGKVLKTVRTPSRNTSGMAFGNNRIWMVANAPPQGVFEVDMNSKLISHRQIPLGPANDGGGCHGAMWQDGKLWIAALRLRALLRVDPVTWTPEFMIPFYQSAERNRYHAMAWDASVPGQPAIWQAVGNDSKSFAEGKPGLVKYDAVTGKVLELVDFLPGSADPHGLVMHNGTLISCDAGIHPNWPNNDSPMSGWIFRIDFV
ncbi:MAG: hypothetical protein EBY17_02825 [Acidobacteriia bacterium]|jgi:hypothetical protein|nr:hypothetical protein [Terriglobia bacterium]